MRTDGNQGRIEALADLIVRFGANVQPGQIVSLASEPGKEPLARAIAEAAYKAGAKFVDLSVFDIHVKHARMLHADPDDAGLRPAVVRRSDAHARRAALGGDRADRSGRPAHHGRDRSGPARPRPVAARAGVDRDRQPARLELDRGAVPDRVVGRAGVSGARAGGRARAPMAEVAHICRVDEPDPVAAWEERMDALVAVADKLDRMRLDALHFEGPGTDLTVGLLPSCHWHCARISTVDGIVHAPNLPTEEVFTTPDPERTEGHVSSTKPLFVSGAMVTGLRVRFERGQAVELEADQGADTLRALTRRDPGSGALARWPWSTARAASAAWTRCSSTRCSTRTRRATSRSARGSTSRSARRITRGSTARAPHRLHDRIRRRWRSPGSSAAAARCRCCAVAPGRSEVFANARARPRATLARRTERCRSG